MIDSEVSCWGFDPTYGFLIMSGHNETESALVCAGKWSVEPVSGTENYLGTEVLAER